MRGCPQASPSGTSPGEEGDFRWTLASLRPAVTPLLLQSEFIHPRACLYPMVCEFFWDGVSPSVNYVWPCVSGGFSLCKLTHTDTHRNTHTHIHILTKECVFSGVHIAWSMMWWLASHWKASLFVPIASRHLMWHTQNDTDSVKSTGCAYNSNLHCTCFWITAQFPLNHGWIIMTQIIWMQSWHRPNFSTQTLSTL